MRILKPSDEYFFYHTVVGEHGTGKTTVVKQAAKEAGKGVIYVSIPSELENFGDEFAKALGWSFDEHISLTGAFGRKFLGIPLESGKSQESKLRRARNAFEHGAAHYKAKYGKPPVLILDNINILGKENPRLLNILQDDAKYHADESNYVTVFVSSEGTVPRMMMTRSSWSRAKHPVVIGDLTETEALKYLEAKLGITEKRLSARKEEIEQLSSIAMKLFELLGGRIGHLKMYSDDIANGMTFEGVRYKASSAAKNSFSEARMLKGQANHGIGKRIIQELLKKTKIDIEDYYNLVNNEDLAERILRANVFSFDPAEQTITFQSRLIETYVRELFK